MKTNDKMPKTPKAMTEQPKEAPKTTTKTPNKSGCGCGCGNNKK